MLVGTVIGQLKDMPTLGLPSGRLVNWQMLSAAGLGFCRQKPVSARHNVLTILGLIASSKFKLGIN